MNPTLKKYPAEIIGGLLCLTLGLLSGYSVNASDPLWYSHLNKPNFNPPSWIFGPAWTILYLLYYQCELMRGVFNLNLKYNNLYAISH
jgi:tryptophan-rich sensory protein